MKKIIIVTFVFVLIAPQIVFAAWWNPFSWNWGALFNSPTQTETQNVVSSTTPFVLTGDIKATTTPVVTPHSKKTDQQAKNPIVTRPNPTASISVVEPNPTVSVAVPPPVVITTPPPNTTFCNGKNYSSCPVGQTLICPANGSGAVCSNPQQQQNQQQAQIDAANLQATQNSQQQAAAQAKQDKLNAINLQIVALNAKYAADLKALTSNGSMSQDATAPIIQDLNNRYTIDYDALQAQYQLIQYSN